MLEVLEGRWLLSAYVVTSTADDGAGTLREAINQVNAGSYNEIDFSIGSAGSAQTISLASALPVLTASNVFINGGSQGGSTSTSPLIEVKGISARMATGLEIDGSGCQVSGLTIDFFDNVGIDVRGADNTIGGTTAGAGNVISSNGGDGILIESAGVLVAGNHIGTDAAGTSALPNKDFGVEIETSGTTPVNASITIGGVTSSSRNVISGNKSSGVYIGEFVSGVAVQGNWIGLSSADTALGNYDGIDVEGPDNTIGGSIAGARNIISGNSHAGIVIGPSDLGIERRNYVSGNLVQGNNIGTNKTGARAVPNSNGIADAGIMNTIGGTSASARNIISGNTNNGVVFEGGDAMGEELLEGNYIGTDATGGKVLGNGNNGVEDDWFDNTIGGTTSAAGNVISGNGNNGITLGARALLEGNYIGTNVNGTKALHNKNGLEIGGSDNTIGGDIGTARNIISGNSNDGILLDQGATGNVLQGNIVGADLAGAAALANNTGIEIQGAANTLGGTVSGVGNVISGNTKDGVHVASTGSGNLLLGNLIGTNSAGTSALGNGINGIDMKSASNTVGGTGAGAGNIISGNANDGVFIGATASGVFVQGNRVGVDSTGGSAIGNGGHGIEVQGSLDTIGGTTPGARNVISGNTKDGLFLPDPASENMVLGNYIGTDAAGSSAIANGRNGIEIQSVANTIGGIASDAGNVISGNTNDGVLLTSAATGTLLQGNYIGTDATASTALANSRQGIEVQGSGNTIGGTDAGAGNIISGNSKSGVLLATSASATLLQGNLIGTTYAGAAALGNAINGIDMRSANNTIGGTSAGAGNVISGNANDGVYIGPSASGVLVQGSSIGVDSTGANALGNGGHGIEVQGVGSTLGGSTTAARNVISGNGKDGILLGSSSSGTTLQANFVGTDAAGAAALGNGRNGLEVVGASNTIGGTVWAARNVLSGNSNDGMLLASTGNLVQTNVVGGNKDSTAALANKVGIEVAASFNTIGGSTSASRNIVSGNTGDGLLVDSSASLVLIQSNYLGLTSAGNAMGNGGYGVHIAGSGITTSGNWIANNAAGGVLVSSGSRNFLRNTVYANGPSQQGPGIVLASGANNNLAAPVLTSATLSNGTLTVKGSYYVPVANATYRVDFFANPSGDPEGKIFLGFQSATAPSTGTRFFTFIVKTSVTGSNPLITATLTDGVSDTSAFSNGVTTTT